MCIGVHVFASTYCCACTKAGGKENMGGVEIQSDVLHLPVVNSRHTKSKLVRQQKGSFPLNIICQRPNPRQLMLLPKGGHARPTLCDTIARD